MSFARCSFNLAYLVLGTSNGPLVLFYSKVVRVLVSRCLGGSGEHPKRTLGPRCFPRDSATPRTTIEGFLLVDAPQSPDASVRYGTLYTGWINSNQAWRLSYPDVRAPYFPVGLVAWCTRRCSHQVRVHQEGRTTTGPPYSLVRDESGKPHFRLIIEVPYSLAPERFTDPQPLPEDYRYEDGKDYIYEI